MLWPYRNLLLHTDVTRVVTDSIRAGTPLWESLVPHHVATEIKQKNLLGHRTQPPRQHKFPWLQLNPVTGAGAADGKVGIGGLANGGDAGSGGLDDQHVMGAPASTS